MNGVGNERSSWLHEAEWLSLRTVARCENVILPLWSLPGLPQQTGCGLAELDESSGLGTEPLRDSGSRHRARGRVQTFLCGSRRHRDGASIQSYDGSWALGDGRALWCSTCEPTDPFCFSVRDHADEGLQGHEEDVLLDGEISTTASTPRELALFGLRGARIGRPSWPEMEGVRDGRAAWLADLPKSTIVGGSPPCRASVLVPLFLGQVQTEEAKRIDSEDRKRLDTLVSRAIWTLSWMHGEFSRTPAYWSSSVTRGQNILSLHRQSLRRIALAENLETAPFLDELLPSQNSNLAADSAAAVRTK